VLGGVLGPRCFVRPPPPDHDPSADQRWRFKAGRMLRAESSGGRGIRRAGHRVTKVAADGERRGSAGGAQGEGTTGGGGFAWVHFVSLAQTRPKCPVL
jgi:hypothetical protein